MRRILGMLLCAAVAVPAIAAAKTGWEEDGLAGRVKTIREVRTAVNKKDDSAVRVTKYDNTGKRLEWTRSNAAGVVKDHTTYSYAASGNLSELAYFADKNQPDTTARYAYNEKGQRTELANYDSKGVLKDKTVSVYDTAGLESEASRYDGKGKLFAKIKYTRDAEGRLTGEERRGRDDDVLERVTTVYDSHGFVQERTAVDGDGKVTSHERWLNDSKGNKTEWFVYDADGAVKEHWAYEYVLDKSGNWTRRRTFRLSGGDEKPSRVVAYESVRTIEYW